MKELTGKILQGERITTDQALRLMNDAPLSLLAMLATAVKERKNGKNVYYNRNFHIEPSNVCVYDCRFCSYHRDEGSPQAWNHSLDEIFEMVRSRRHSGATEIHIVGGVHPAHDLDYYAEMVRGVKSIMPQATVKAFSAVELDVMITRAGLSFEQGLALLKEAGMETLPGGGAEIFDEGVRARICPKKTSSERWLALHAAAHRSGIPTNATMLYGHIETAAHRIDHMNRLRKLQDETDGFNAFIPLKFRSAGNSMSGLGEVPITEDMRTLAVSRIFLDNFPHVKAYWAMYGKDVAQIALAFGADDMDGTIEDSTKIYSMAGADDKNPAMSVPQMERLIKEAGYTPVERDSFYNAILR